MQWYIDTTDWTVHHATQATAEAHGWYGPYPTQAAAQAAANQGSGSTGGSGGGGGQGSPGTGAKTWWVVENQAHLYKEINSPTKPSGGGIIRVWGPLTKAQADRLLQPGGLAPYQPPGVSGTGGLAAIGDFFSKLGQANTWIRVAEVLLGLGLIIVGLAKLASGTAAGKAAIKAGKAAAIL